MRRPARLALTAVLLVGLASLQGAHCQGLLGRQLGRMRDGSSSADSTSPEPTAGAGSAAPSNAEPAAPSSSAKSTQGGVLTGTTQTAQPTEEGITVSTTATSPVSNVQLVYTVGYGGQEETAAMMGDGKTYSAVIPASAYAPGSLVRWAVQATGPSGEVRDPVLDSEGPKYYGTIVADPSDPASTLPVVELYCPDPKAPFGVNATRGCSVQLNGRFYDNVNVSRRGSTSMAWPKPKVRIEAPKNGPKFLIKEGVPEVSKLNLNSEWSEQGENTFMRETLVWEYLRQAGAEYLPGYQAHVRMNGDYYGKFAVGTTWNKDFLKASGLNVEPLGPLWKAANGQYSNLRWDEPADQIQWNWDKESRKTEQDDQLLKDFTRGIAGGGPEPKSKYLFDHVNLPQVINNMAAMTLINNNDRCTKNYYVYYDLSTQQWSMLAWDVESGFGSDRGLNGLPAPDYCILECPQWNSPLYCDRDHPQDLEVNTPWSVITSSYDLGPSGRRLLQDQGTALLEAGSPKPVGQAAADLAAAGLAAPPAAEAAGAGAQPPAAVAGRSDYDADLTTQGATKTGAGGTYNYLMDAILSVPRTREMYLRRLRTLMDTFYSTGRLEQLVTSSYNEIKAEAELDTKKWGNPGSAERGYRSLLEDVLPLRKKQLFETYGPGGPTPLIPASQPDSVRLEVGRTAAGQGGFVEIVNPNPFAVDVSGWKLSGDATFTAAPGTVIPSQDSMFIVSSIPEFRNRPESPKGGEGHFMVGPLSGTPSESVSFSQGPPVSAAGG